MKKDASTSPSSGLSASGLDHVVRGTGDAQRGLASPPVLER
jgi:hypothetical protein